MLDWVPIRVWLLIAIAAIAYTPAVYVWRHLLHSPSRRDITQPPEDLSWRTAGHLLRSLLALAVLVGLAVFIWTPAAAVFARSPRFWPVLLLGCGLFVLITLWRAYKTGEIEPLVRGFHNRYRRDEQPKLYWATIVWNGVIGVACFWVAFETNQEAAADALRDRCYDERTAFSPQEVLDACNELLSNPEIRPARVVDYLGGRGIAHYRLGDYRRAIADYDEAIRLDPTDYYPRYNRGLAYRALGEAGFAAADFTVAISLRPDDPDAYLERGLIQLDRGRLDEAAADFTRAHELKPRDAWPLANRGLAYAWKRDRARAESDFAKVRSIDPSNPGLLRGEALLAIDAGDRKTAIARLSQALNRDPGDNWSLRMRAEVYRRLGEHEKARADDDKAEQIGHDRDGPRARSSRGSPPAPSSP